MTAGRYEAILVPQRAALELEIQTSDGNRHIKTFQATDLQSGAEYAIEAVISNTNKIHASISGAVKGWEDGGAIAPVEDDLPEDSDLLEYAGVKYRIRQLSNGTTWMAENLRYIPEGKRVSSSPVRRKRHLVPLYDLLYRIQRHGIHPTAGVALRSGYSRRGTCYCG